MAKSLEETFRGIEEIIEKMESEDVTLEDSFAFYQKGMEELKNCNQILDQVEKKMQMINANGELEDFEA
ncbi:MAG: exodeoxyribonuclease VII small subunit [Roseburia sp.]